MPLHNEADSKTLWSSALWLVCAAHGGCAVDEAHARHPAVLRALVAELLREAPRAAAELLRGGGGGGAGDGGDASDGDAADGFHPEEDEEERAIDAALRSLRTYSDSMPGVVPSAAMARGEIAERNGWFLRAAAAAGRAQPTHEALLCEVGVSPAAAAGDARPAPAASIACSPLAPFGALVEAASVDDLLASGAALREAWLAHGGLLVVRGLTKLTPRQLHAVSALFGEVGARPRGAIDRAEHSSDCVRLHPRSLAGPR